MNELTETSTTVIERQNESAETAEITPAGDALVETDLLVEEVSIDGMCGVY